MHSGTSNLDIAGRIIYHSSSKSSRYVADIFWLECSIYESHFLVCWIHACTYKKYIYTPVIDVVAKMYEYNLVPSSDKIETHEKISDGHDISFYIKN